MTNEFNTALVKFLIGLTDMMEEKYKDFPLGVPEVSVRKGRRYLKVVKKDVAQTFVHCFIDTTNGNVLKAAGWKSPAKHARGNIFNADNGLGAVTVYGARYL